MKSAIPQKRKSGLYRRDNVYLYIMIAVPALLIFIFKYLPMGGLVLAFKDYRYDLGILGSKWCGLKNFMYFLKSNDFGTVTRNTLLLNFGFMVFGTIAAVTVAILMSNVIKARYVKTYQTVLILPHFLSWVIVGYVAYAILNPEFGLANTLLEKLGKGRISWYSEPKYWPSILTVASVWKHVGMNSIIYYSALLGIDETLYEAAEIDGASSWQKTKYITLPSILSMIVMLNILAVGNIFRADFGLFYQLTRDSGALYATTDVMDTYVFRVMRTMGDVSTSAAAGFVQSIVGFITVVTTNAIVRKIDSDSALY